MVDEAAAAKFACVKATGTLDAEAAEVFSLFLDNERVHVSGRRAALGVAQTPRSLKDLYSWPINIIFRNCRRVIWWTMPWARL